MGHIDANGDDRGILPRRRALKLLGGAAVVAAVGEVGVLTSCSRGGGTEIRVPLESLPVGTRTRVLHGEDPVELLRTPEGVVARSLLCTHVGCEVKWSEEQGAYLCPCHEGIYDADGNVTAGPPPTPLRRLTVTVIDEAVILGGPPAAS